MQAELSDVQKAELVSRNEVHRQKLSETVLGDSDLVLDLVTTTSNFTLLGEFVVHFL